MAANSTYRPVDAAYILGSIDSLNAFSRTDSDVLAEVGSVARVGGHPSTLATAYQEGRNDIASHDSVESLIQATSTRERNPSRTGLYWADLHRALIRSLDLPRTLTDEKVRAFRDAMRNAHAASLGGSNDDEFEALWDAVSEAAILLDVMREDVFPGEDPYEDPENF